MPRTSNTVIVRGPIDKVFDLSNDITKWPKLFTHYDKVEILKQSGNEYYFRLTTTPGTDSGSKQWESARTVFRDKWYATAERLNPKFPFAFLKMKWEYEECTDGTMMTWIQEFEMDPSSGKSNKDGEAHMKMTILREMQAVKKNIEILLNDELN